MIKVDQSLRDFIYQNLNLILQTDEGYQKLNNNQSSVEEETEKLDKLYFRVSQLVSCPRKEYLRCKGEKQMLTAESYLILSMGSDIHRRIQASLENVMISKEEILIKDLGDYYIVGHYDGIIDYNGKNTFIEMKSMSPYAFKQIAKELTEIEKDYNNLNPDSNLFKYLAQANTYLYIYRELNKQPKVDESWLVFINKATIKGVDPLFTLRFDYDENLAGMIFEKSKYIYNCLKTNTPPTPSDNWECGYCGYWGCEYNVKR